MKRNKTKSYTLDSSAIIHLAAIRKWHSNSFRITATLTENINPETLQSALNKIIYRFPTIASGIREGFFRHTVVPIKTAPKIMRDNECLSYMAKKEIERCAFRILYREKQVVAEFFHSLTDGYGAIVFVKALLAEYLNQSYKLNMEIKRINPSKPPRPEELKDDYITYAENSKATVKYKKVYQLPGTPSKNGKIQTISYTYDSQELLALAHHYNVGVTALLCAVMLMSIAEIQRKHSKSERCKMTVQIMIPVNLRKMFPSKTLRNFSLYVLPCIEKNECSRSFEYIVTLVQKQLDEQATKEKMSAAISTYISLVQHPLVKRLPWKLKGLILKIAHYHFGEQNSCISLSNLGVVSSPRKMSEYVERMDFVLTPRIRSLYNCGVVSYNGKCSVTFSRLCAESELEDCFFRLLTKLTCSS
ncbi:MAG: hypothetical protein ACI4KR_00655 [Ruminiclostridium sp.]